jgi:hypothetical protein
MSSSQQFGVIHLSNPDLTYIRNVARETKLLLHFHLLKTYRESFSILYLFFHPPNHANTNTDRRAYISAGGEFCQVFIFAKLGYQTVEDQFSCFTKPS